MIDLRIGIIYKDLANLKFGYWDFDPPLLKKKTIFFYQMIRRRLVQLIINNVQKKFKLPSTLCG